MNEIFTEKILAAVAQLNLRCFLVSWRQNFTNANPNFILVEPAVVSAMASIVGGNDFYSKEINCLNITRLIANRLALYYKPDFQSDLLFITTDVLVDLRDLSRLDEYFKKSPSLEAQDQDGYKIPEITPSYITNLLPNTEYIKIHNLCTLENIEALVNKNDQLDLLSVAYALCVFLLNQLQEMAQMNLKIAIELYTQGNLEFADNMRVIIKNLAKLNYEKSAKLIVNNDQSFLELNTTFKNYVFEMCADYANFKSTYQKFISTQALNTAKLTQIRQLSEMLTLAEVNNTLVKVHSLTRELSHDLKNNTALLYFKSASLGYRAICELLASAYSKIISRYGELFCDQIVTMLQKIEISNDPAMLDLVKKLSQLYPQTAHMEFVALARNLPWSIDAQVIRALCSEFYSHFELILADNHFTLEALGAHAQALHFARQQLAAQILPLVCANLHLVQLTQCLEQQQTFSLATPDFDQSWLRELGLYQYNYNVANLAPDLMLKLGLSVLLNKQELMNQAEILIVSVRSALSLSEQKLQKNLDKAVKLSAQRQLQVKDYALCCAWLAKYRSLTVRINIVNDQLEFNSLLESTEVELHRLAACIDQLSASLMVNNSQVQQAAVAQLFSDYATQDLALKDLAANLDISNFECCQRLAMQFNEYLLLNSYAEKIDQDLVSYEQVLQQILACQRVLLDSNLQFFANPELMQLVEGLQRSPILQNYVSSVLTIYEFEPSIPALIAEIASKTLDNFLPIHNLYKIACQKIIRAQVSLEAFALAKRFLGFSIFTYEAHNLDDLYVLHNHLEIGRVIFDHQQGRELTFNLLGSIKQSLDIKPFSTYSKNPESCSLFFTQGPFVNYRLRQVWYATLSKQSALVNAHLQCGDIRCQALVTDIINLQAEITNMSTIADNSSTFKRTILRPLQDSLNKLVLELSLEVPGLVDFKNVLNIA